MRPKRLLSALSVSPLLAPYLPHDIIRNYLSSGFGERPPVLSLGRADHAAGDQPAYLFGIIVDVAGNNSRNRSVAVAHQHLFPMLHILDMGAQMGLQLADVYSPHKPSLPQYDHVGHFRIALKPREDAGIVVAGCSKK